jgi:hypothetical protein
MMRPVETGYLVERKTWLVVYIFEDLEMLAITLAIESWALPGRMLDAAGSADAVHRCTAALERRDSRDWWD